MSLSTPIHVVQSVATVAPLLLLREPSFAPLQDEVICSHSSSSGTETQLQ